MKDRRAELAAYPRESRDIPPGNEPPPFLRCAPADRIGTHKIEIYYNPEVGKYVAQFVDIPLLAACNDTVPLLFKSLAFSVERFVDVELPKYDGLSNDGKAMMVEIGEFKALCEMGD